ncbi:N/A [soil metagenome]
MNAFSNLPIRRKLVVAFVGVTSASLLLACTAFIVHEKNEFKASMSRNLTVLADALGKNCTAALSFANEGDAEETLQALSFEPSVISGALYTEKGELFSSYSQGEEKGVVPKNPGMDVPSFDVDYLVLFRPVELNGKRIGTIYLKSSLQGVRDRIRSSIGIASMVLVGSLLATLLLSAGFQRIISAPILNLVKASKLIIEKKDYSVRVPLKTADELGQLTDSFNHMLADIQERDQELVRANAELHQQIDARVLAEERLKVLNEQLEQRVADRTEELQRSNQELEQFAYVASHDLQEPLRMVSSYMQLIERRYKGKLDADADQFIDFAVDGAKRMQALIQALLAYSRVGSRGKPLEPTSSAKVFEEVMANLQIAIEEAGATVTHDELPTVMADATQLSQLLQNLASNALKFRGAEAPRIHIGVKKEKRNWIFSAHDNGIGIEQQFFDRIFVIFQRLHTRGEYPGTGIGLAVCRKIVERHGGRIWLESEPGKGTTFYFTIPVSLEKPNIP